MGLPPSRVDETAQRFPPYTPLMLVLSLIYVVLALAFSARVLDSIGTSPSDAQLTQLSGWSQTLFGCAVALAIWGGGVLPRLEGTALGWRLRWLILVTAGATGVALSVLAHRGATHLLTDDPTGLMGRKAVTLNLLAHAAYDAHIPVPDLHLEPDFLAGPAGRSFLALLLATEMTSKPPGLPLDNTVRRAMQELAAQRVGTAAQVYDNVFVPSVRSLKDAYNAYVAAQTALVDDIRIILEQQDTAWNEYLETLARRGVNPAKLARHEWGPITAEVRMAGVAVPADWNPADKAVYSRNRRASGLRRNTRSACNGCLARNCRQGWSGNNSMPARSCNHAGAPQFMGR